MRTGVLASIAGSCPEGERFESFVRTIMINKYITN